MYCDAAEEEDKEMVERWQKDAEGILIFVSPHIGIHAALSINWKTIDRSILCRRRGTPGCDRRRSETKQSGYFCILSWEYLRVSRRPERNTCFRSLPCRPTASVLSSEICRLGEFTLVLEPGHGP